MWLFNKKDSSGLVAKAYSTTSIKVDIDIRCEPLQSNVVDWLTPILMEKYFRDIGLDKKIAKVVKKALTKRTKAIVNELRDMIDRKLRQEG